MPLFNRFFLETFVPGFNSNKGLISPFYFTPFFSAFLEPFFLKVEDFSWLYLQSKVWETQKPIWKVWENMPSLWPVILDEKLPPPHIQKRIKMASSAFWYWKKSKAVPHFLKLHICSATPNTYITVLCIYVLQSCILGVL